MKLNYLKSETPHHSHHHSEVHSEMEKHSEAHPPHGHHDHGEHEEAHELQSPPVPLQFKMQIFAGAAFSSHYLPKPLFSPGAEGGVLLGVQQGKKHFLLGPTFQWSRGQHQSHGIETQVRNLFAGLELRFGRSLGKRWAISLSPTIGLRLLKASSLVLEQGIILDAQDKAFEVQGKLQASFQISRAWGLFCRFHLGQAFYLTAQEVFPLNGFHWGSSLGFYWSIR